MSSSPTRLTQVLLRARENTSTSDLQDQSITYHRGEITDFSEPLGIRYFLLVSCVRSILGSLPFPVTPLHSSSCSFCSIVDASSNSGFLCSSWSEMYPVPIKNRTWTRTLDVELWIQPKPMIAMQYSCPEKFQIDVLHMNCIR